MKKTVFLAILLSVVSLSSFAQSVSVGAWNIQWLGTPANRDCVEQRPRDIARYIRESGVQVLALEEISDTDFRVATRTNRILDAAFEEINSSGGNSWRYLLFPKKNQGQEDRDLTQMTGIAWNERSVTFVGDPFRIPLTLPSDGINYWDRWATAVKLRFGNNRTDAVFIPVHMKANVGGNFRTQRAKEAEILVNALVSVRNQFDDQDIIILGDTNILTRTERAVSVFTDNNFIDLNSGDIGTLGSAPFDRAFVPRGQPEFADSTMSLFRLNGVTMANFQQFYSDHLMIRFDIRINNDDD